MMRVSLKPLFNLHKLNELIHTVNTLLGLFVTFTKYFRILSSRIQYWTLGSVTGEEF